MKDLLHRLVKWGLNVLLFILGLKMIYMAIQGQMWAFMFGLILIGIVHWQYNGRDDIPKQIIGVTVFIMGLAGALAFYLPLLAFFPFNVGAFMSWAGWTMLLGLPVVGWAFHRFR